MGYPHRQLLILAVCRLAEPIAMTSVFPYLFFMLRSFNDLQDDGHIAQFAGIVAASFSFSSFLSSIFWGRMSDLYGRKPVVLLGLLGVNFASLLFGFSTCLPMAIIARSLAGLLNGNVGVLRTMVAELVTEKEHQAKAFILMPVVYSLGCIIGPFLGGALADPAKSYPSLFGGVTFFEEYPFALPNLVVSALLTVSFVVGFLFIRETHESFKEKPDPGLKFRNWLVSYFSSLNDRKTFMYSQSAKVDEDEQQLLLPQRLSPHTTSVATLTSKSSSSFKDIFTFQTRLNLLAYVILAFHTMSFDQILPIFLSLDYRPRGFSFFHIEGGLGLSSKEVGMVLSLTGAAALTFQFLAFPSVQKRLGTITCFRLALCGFPLAYIFVPYLSFTPPFKTLIWPLLIILQIMKALFSVFAYPCSSILITNAVPSKSVLGTINGIAQALASLARATGPFICGFLFTLGDERGCGWLVWWVLFFVSLWGSLQSLWIEEADASSEE